MVSSLGRWGILATILVFSLIMASYLPGVAAGRKRPRDSTRTRRMDDTLDEDQDQDEDSVIVTGGGRPATSPPPVVPHQDIPAGQPQSSLDQPAFPYLNASVGYISLHNVDHPKPGKTHFNSFTSVSYNLLCLFPVCSLTIHCLFLTQIFVLTEMCGLGMFPSYCTSRLLWLQSLTSSGCSCCMSRWYTIHR